MFLDDNSKSKTRSNDRKIKEFTIRLTALQREIDDLFDELGMSPEELEAYLNKSDNFSPEEWKQIQENAKKTEEELAKNEEIDADPLKTRSKYKEKSEICNHWLFLR